MTVLFIVLNKLEYLEDILDMFLDQGVKGATILDSQGLGRTLEDSLPSFGTIRQLMDGSRPYNKTIFTVIECPEKLDRVINQVEEIVIDLDEPGIGMMFTIPVEEIHGLNPN